MRKLIIHADDFGLSPGVNQGILAAIREGAVTSTSLLINFPSSENALELAKRHALDLGWHINLTLGRPLSSPHEIPSLLQGNGTFFPLASFIQRCLLKKIRTQELLVELSAQWRRFQETGLSLTHVDGHQHVHTLPIVCEVVREFLIEHPIPFLRIPREPLRGGGTRWGARLFLNFLKGTRLSFWQGAGVRSLPFYGLSLGHHAGQLSGWKRLLKNIREDTAEIMVHPGYSSLLEDRAGDDFPGNREEELHLLRSQGLKSLIGEMGFTLVGFRDLL